MSSLWRNIATIGLVIAAVCQVSFAAPPVAADSAPMWDSPVGLKPGLSNNTVRMTAETVDVDVVEREGGTYAKVSAVFDLVNRGPDAQMRVGFPEYNYPVVVGENRDQVMFSSQALRDFQAWSGGTRYQARKEKVILEGNQDSWGTEWFVWTMSFPKGSTTKLNVTYEQKLADGAGAVNVFYVLTTGALWDGTIGSASIRMNAATGGALAAADRGVTYTFAPKVAWEKRDFKPVEDVLAIYIPASTWKTLQAAEGAIAAGTATGADYAAGAAAVVNMTEDGTRVGQQRANLRDTYFHGAVGWARTAIDADEGNAAAWETLGDLDYAASRTGKGNPKCQPQVAPGAYQSAADLGSASAPAKLAEMQDNLDWANSVMGPLEPCP